MKKVSYVLPIALVSALAWLPFHVQAQTAASSEEQDSSQPVEEVVENGEKTGLSVTEIRYKNRLDEVIVEHESGLREYYEFDDSRTVHQDGSISERGNLRKWRIGGGN